MKVSIIIPFYGEGYGGAEIQAKMLAEELVKRDIDVSVITFKEKNRPLVENVNGVKIYRILKSVRMASSQPFIACLKYIKKLNPDLIHSFFAYPTGVWCIIPKMIFCKPLIISVRGGDIQTEKNINYGIRLNPIKALLVKLAMKTCDKVVAIGQDMVGDALEAGAPREKIIVIPNIMPKRKLVSKKLLTKVAKKYKIDRKKLILLYLGRISKEKNLSILVNAIKKLNGELKKKMQVIIAGYGNIKEVNKLKEEIKQDKIIHFIGPIFGDEKAALYTLSDIFVLPSLREGFPTTLLEIMPYGICPVGSNIKGIREIIKNGSSGFLFPPKDSAKLKKIIEILLRNKKLRKRIFLANKKLLKKYSSRRIAEKYIQVYKSEIK
jgi:glycosyltransferase involved in cell wall biosynthesis